MSERLLTIIDLMQWDKQGQTEESESERHQQFSHIMFELLEATFYN
ncbi:hypothetical protein [Paenibacillus sp. FSL K6-0108]